MSDTPSTFANRVLNLAERLGSECKAIYSAIAGKMSATEADARYLGINNTANAALCDGQGKVISDTYATKEEAKLPEEIDLGGLS